MQTELVNLLHSIVFYDDKHYKLLGLPVGLPVCLKMFEEKLTDDIQTFVVEVVESIYNFCMLNKIDATSLKETFDYYGILTKEVAGKWNYGDYSSKKFQVAFIITNLIPRVFDTIKLFYGGIKKGLITPSMGVGCSIACGPTIESILFKKLYFAKFNKEIIIDNYDKEDWNFSFNTNSNIRIGPWRDEFFEQYSWGLMSFGVSSNIVDLSVLCSDKKILLSIESHQSYRPDIRSFVPFDDTNAYGAFCTYSKISFASCKYIALERKTEYSYVPDVLITRAPNYTVVETEDCISDVDLHAVIHEVEQPIECCSVYNENCVNIEISDKLFSDVTTLYARYVGKYEYLYQYFEPFKEACSLAIKYGYTFKFNCDKEYHTIKNNPDNCDCNIILRKHDKRFLIKRDKLPVMVEDLVGYITCEVTVTNDRVSLSSYIFEIDTSGTIVRKRREYGDDGVIACVATRVEVITSRKDKDSRNGNKAKIKENKPK